jgi:tRNA (mo5U34)-methyltransferase
MTEMNPQDVETQVRELGPWFHNMEIAGVQTAPEHFLGDYPRFKWEKFATAIPADLTGKSVLDIGCNAGFYSLEMKRRGAARVLGIDSDEHYLRQARFAAGIAGADIEFRQLSVYDIAVLGEQFDLVLFMGVLYHLRYPLLALDLLHRVVRETLVFQTMLRGTADLPELAGDYDFEERAMFNEPAYPKLFFVEQRYAHDPTNWWIPNRACAEAMLRSAGFTVANHPEEEVFICSKGTAAVTEIPSRLIGEERS